jgi:uncharacterized repeat protein (TIGR01451 family)
MGKVRVARSVLRVFIVLAVAVFGLVAAETAAVARHHPPPTHTTTTPPTSPPPPAHQAVVPSVHWVCPSDGGLEASFGYANPNSFTVNLTDTRNGGDHDSDDNFFSPDPGNRGQTTSFAPGFHDDVTQQTFPSNQTLKWTLQTSSTATAGPGPFNCADLGAAKSQTLSTVTVNNEQDYLVVVTNNGPTAADNVTITDTLSTSAVSIISVTPSTGSCSVALPTITCGSIPTLASGAGVSITIKLKPTATGTLSDQVSASSDTHDPNPSNNSASVSASVQPVGGSSGGGILNQGQALTVNGITGTSGTVTAQNGTTPLTLAIEPQGSCPAGATCKSDLLDIEPIASGGNTLTAVFNTGKPSPFVLIPFVKFFVYKDGVDKPLPFCKPYLFHPQPLPDGSACEYFRWMNWKGEAIVYVALGTQDPRVHR